MTRQQVPDPLAACARLRPPGPGDRPPDANAGDLGWVVFSAVPGWEDHSVEVRASTRDGEPRVVELRLLARPDAEVSAVTHTRLRSLPVHRLAAVAVGLMHPTDPQVWQELLAVAKPPEDKRAVASVEQAAAIYHAARAAKESPRKAIMRELCVGDRTAFRYLARARQAGLIPDENQESTDAQGE